MTQRVQLRRTTTTGQTPPQILSGELIVNQTDRQLFMGDASSTPRPLLAIQPYTVDASYPALTLVNNGGTVYRANADIAPGPFDPAQWDKLTSSALPADAPGALTNDGAGALAWERYLPIAGGALTGPVTAAANPTVALGLATKQYVDTGDALALPKAGGALTGPVTAAADPTVPLGLATKQYADAVGAATDVGRNMVQNGRFNIQQRGAGNWTTPGVTLDRWLLNLLGDTATVWAYSIADAERTAIGDESAAYALAITVAGAATPGNYTIITQSLEDVRRLAGKTVTLSFWAIGSAPLNIGLRLNQIMGTGGAPSAGGSAVTQIRALTGGWTRYTATFALPSLAGKTLGTNNDHYTQLAFDCSLAESAGVQSGSIVLWGVQLEVGAVATALENKGVRAELADCQRFFQSGSGAVGGYTGGAVTVYEVIGLPTTMRAQPTIISAAVSPANLASLTVLPQGGSAVVVEAVTMNTAAAFVSGVTFTASAEL